MAATLPIILGIALIVAGAFGLFGAYEAFSTGPAALSWGAIIGGTLLMFAGLARRVGSAMKPPENHESDQGSAEIRALVQSMGAMAAADGKIEDAEIGTISEIYEQMLGLKITPDEVREILSEFSPGFDIASRLERDRALISPAMKRTILQSCHLVMISDLDVAKSETRRIHDIGNALGFSDDDTDSLIAAASI